MNSKNLSPKQAYELALETLKEFESKWRAYVEEEARRFYAFDESKGE